MSIFEIAMLICFGASWPFALRKTYKTKNVKGISVFFLYLVIFGYLCGAVHKYVYDLDFVIYLYLFNGLLVAGDLFLYYRYKNLNN